MMSINSEGLELIRQFEGLRCEAYQDQAGIWTIGYGCTGSIKPGTQITRAEADLLLLGRLDYLATELTKRIQVPLNSNEFSACCCLAYNIGIHAFQHSTLLKELNEGNRQRASDEFLKWSKVDGKEVAGLLRRRASERGLFLKPIHSQLS